MKIYVASSWRNPHHPAVVERLRWEGFQVYDFRMPSRDDHGFHWSEIDPDWQSWHVPAYRAALDHPLAEVGFASDSGAMKWADICVLVLPCGRSAHTEAGVMAGWGKPVAVLSFGPCEPELMYKFFGLVTDSIAEVVLWARQWEAGI